MINENPLSSARDLTKIIYKSAGIMIGSRTINSKISDWNIKRPVKEKIQKKLVINLLKKGYSLFEIWIDKQKGLGFSKRSWEKNRWRFFRRIFKNDNLVTEGKGNIIERIEKAYCSNL